MQSMPSTVIGSRRSAGGQIRGFVLGLAAAAAVVCLWRIAAPGGPGADLMAAPVSDLFLRQAQADLEDGDYSFFANRRNIWVVNRRNGRMANYHFRDDQVGSVDRSRVAALDTKTFPAQDTIIQLSDRNMNNVLWVCNARTGDVQMWTVARDGTLKGEAPVACSADLAERTDARAAGK